MLITDPPGIDPSSLRDRMDLAAAIHLGIAALSDALAPWESGSAYLNFTEVTTDPAQFYSGDAYARLRRVKAEVDPEGRFRGNHAIDAPDTRFRTGCSPPLLR